MSRAESPLIGLDAPGIKDPSIPISDLSPHQRYLAFQAESLPTFQRSWDKHWGRGRWQILDLPFEEMESLGTRLSPETVTIMKGFRDVEGYIVDFILAGMSNLRKAGSIKEIQTSWSGDEFSHSVALDNMMMASGMFSQDEIWGQQEEALAEVWRPSQHSGLHCPAGYIAFSTFQERGTYISYYKFIKHIRGEYGLPPEVTPEEKERGMEYGISEGLRRIAGDEIYHHGVFLEQLKLLFKYYPDQTTLVMDEVLDPFKMPAMDLIPGGRQFLRALLKTKVYAKNTQEDEVILPTLNALGFPNREAFSQAVEQAKVKVESGEAPAHPRLFYVPRRYYSKSILEGLAYTAWLDQRARRMPAGLQTIEECQSWCDACGPYVNPFASLPPGVYDINTMKRISATSV